MMSGDDNDRGEFGMAGVGARAARALGLVDISEPEWRVAFTNAGMSVEFTDGCKGYTIPAATPEAQMAIHVMHDVMKNFLLKNAQYARVQSGHDLGIKGIIPDINRKSAAIIARWWDRDGMPNEGEDSNEELFGDLIGHCLLALAKMDADYR